MRYINPHLTFDIENCAVHSDCFLS